MTGRRDPSPPGKRRHSPPRIFYTTHGHHPRGVAQDPTERTLGGWLGRQRSANRSSSRLTRSPRWNAFLDEHYPTWRAPCAIKAAPVTRATWSSRALGCAEFYAAHGHHPRARTADPAERPLGVWLRATRKAALGVGQGTWSPQREAFLEVHYPAWRGGDDWWLLRARAAAAFRVSHSRHPSPKSLDDPERRLGTWLGTNRSACQRGARTWTLERAAFMAAEYPDWRSTRSGSRTAD